MWHRPIYICTTDTRAFLFIVLYSVVLFLNCSESVDTDQLHLLRIFAVCLLLSPIIGWN